MSQSSDHSCLTPRHPLCSSSSSRNSPTNSHELRYYPQALVACPDLRPAPGGLRLGGVQTESARNASNAPSSEGIETLSHVLGPSVVPVRLRRRPWPRRRGSHLTLPAPQLRVCPWSDVQWDRLPRASEAWGNSTLFDEASAKPQRSYLPGHSRGPESCPASGGRQRAETTFLGAAILSSDAFLIPSRPISCPRPLARDLPPLQTSKGLNAALERLYQD
ncbi:hypothetical protein CPLU01_16113 [Colletotrichum plurivorum]|uniref:Uncharacterized protein n=1 Tax=Colletotrichum plurivorum TaxID=2175906 RepID=A0A8H6IZ60_9PEZI|nr:hypothetical protein CPLU01_16113 [Colletotrichum plurivorum]